MKSVILLSAIFASVSGQIFIRPSTTTTRSPVNSFTMPALSANERVYCEILKPQGSAGFLKGSGSFSLKLTLVKEGLVSIDIAAENKTSFIGRKILQRARAQFFKVMPTGWKSTGWGRSCWSTSKNLARGYIDVKNCHGGYFCVLYFYYILFLI